MMSGVDPLYYKEFNAIQEEQVAPLYPSPQMAFQSGPMSGNVTDIVSISDNGSTYPGAALADDLGNITNGIYAAQQPWGAGAMKIYMAQFGSYLVASSSISDQVAYKQVGNAGAFTLLTGDGGSTGVSRFLTPFLDFCCIATGSKIFKMTIGAVPIAPSTAPALDLGQGWTILARPEQYDKYISIPAARALGDYKNNYIFLWDGYSARYTYNIQLPGNFIGQTNIFGSLYVLVEEKVGTQGLYLVSGTRLVKQRNMHGLYTTRQGRGLKVHPLFNAKGYLAILTDSGIFLWRKDETIGEVGYLYNTTNYNCATTSGTSNNIYACTAGTTYFDSIANNKNNMSYLSQYMYVDTPSKIDVWYNTPPQSGTDAINITLYGIDEYDSQGSLFNETIVLNPITPTSNDGSKRTTLDCGGFTGKKMRIGLTTVNTGSWIPIIRKIHIFQEK